MFPSAFAAESVVDAGRGGGAGVETLLCGCGVGGLGDYAERLGDCVSEHV